MKRLLLAIGLLGLAGSAWAQTPPVAPAGQPDTQRYDESRIYASVNVGGSFGNKTSSVFGAEVGLKVNDMFEVFAEGGRMTDVSTSGSDTAASIITTYLASLGMGSATGSVTTPANYAAVGVRYLFPLTNGFEPYVAASVGAANVEKKATFTVNGTDVTSALSLPPYSVQLGEDLSGKANKAMFTIGGGVRRPFGRILVDIGARYGRIFTNPEGTNFFRAFGAVGYLF